MVAHRVQIRVALHPVHRVGEAPFQDERRLSLKGRPPQAIRTAPQGRFNDLIAVFAGLTFYVLFILWAHARLFGVPPLR